MNWRMIGVLTVAMAAITLTAFAAESPKKAAPKSSVEKANADPNAPKWKLLPPEVPAGVTEKQNVICAVYGKTEIPVDLWIPDGDGPFPGILLIHGGGWKQRQVKQDKALAGKLAKAGYVVAQVAYRLSTEAQYPAALHDCKAAVRWMRANAKSLKLDPAHIGCMGGSAGGHLSGLLAMTNGQSQLEGDGGNATMSSEVQACIVMAATMDLLAANSEKTNEGSVQFFGTTAQEKPEIFREASPITYVNAKSVPTIFIEGEKDNLKIGRAEMQQQLRAAGVYTELYTLKYAPHPFWMSDPWCSESAAIAVKFFDKYLKAK
jgi:pectinesterase